MKRIFQLILLLVIAGVVDAQSISKKLQDRVRELKADGQLQNGILAFYVVDQKSGESIFNENGTIGLPVASSQKVLTSVAALDALSAGFRFETTLSYSGNIKDGILTGNLLIRGSGDPTLGSWRYDNTKEQVVLNEWIKAIQSVGIRQINGTIINVNEWGTETVPGGWIWDDIGNYYGAGATQLNWRENQYDLVLRSGASTGNKVSVVRTKPELYDVELTNELTTGRPGSGDNAYIYLPPYSHTGYIRGTIPPNESAFTVSGSFPDPVNQLVEVFREELKKKEITVSESQTGAKHNITNTTKLATHFSPSLDSINYWFLRKSINLYGEALAKTLGFTKKKEGTTAAGVGAIKEFWKDRGIGSTEINIVDGSGLSPLNRITAQALVKVMQYARSQSYFSAFYNALPEFNGIKMKSGTIGGVKSFTGYINGTTFAIVVNNFNGSTADIVRKMYRVLDVLR